MTYNGRESPFVINKSPIGVNEHSGACGDVASLYVRRTVDLLEQFAGELTTRRLLCVDWLSCGYAHTNR